MRHYRINHIAKRVFVLVFTTLSVGLYHDAPLFQTVKTEAIPAKPVYAYHGFNGIEGTVVARVVEWILSK